MDDVRKILTNRDLTVDQTRQKIERLVRAAAEKARVEEREACAQMADGLELAAKEADYNRGCAVMSQAIAAAIRARGKSDD